MNDDDHRVTTPPGQTDVRWWKLYRQERRKFGQWNTRLPDSRIVRCAREATRRFNEGQA